MIAFVAVMVYAGSRAIPLALKYVAGWESQELFILSVTALGLCIGYITYAFGLSFAFGAFMAGLVLSESDYGKRTLSDISSLRDVFSLLFFVSIGMLLDPGILKSHLLATVLLMLTTTLSRGAILSALTYIFGYRNVIPLAAFLTMTPISEIAFIVLQAGMSMGAVGRTEYSIALNAVVLSMIFGPLASGLVAPIYKLTRKKGVIPEVSSINLPRDALADHVVLAGGRSLARYLGVMLARFNIPYVIIESNHANFLKGKEEGLSMLLGDPAQDVVLEAAEVQDAKLVVITTSESMGTVEAIRSIRRHNDKVPILAWAAEKEDVTILENHGVRHIVEPYFEASVEMARQTLTKFGMAATSVHREVAAMRRAMYGHLFEQFREYEDMNGLQSSTNMISLEWVFMHKGNPAEGKKLADSNIRETLGVSVAAIHRAGELIPGPGGDFELHAGDYIGVVGTPEQNRRLVEYFKKPAAK